MQEKTVRSSIHPKKGKMGDAVWEPPQNTDWGSSAPSKQEDSGKPYGLRRIDHHCLTIQQLLLFPNSTQGLFQGSYSSLILCRLRGTMDGCPVFSQFPEGTFHLILAFPARVASIRGSVAWAWPVGCALLGSQTGAEWQMDGRHSWNSFLSTEENSPLLCDCHDAHTACLASSQFCKLPSNC